MAPSNSTSSTANSLFRFQLACSKIKEIPLPAPSVWKRVVDQSSILLASLDAKITNSRALLFCSKLPRNLYQCVLGVKSGFLLVYSDPRNGYAFDLTRAKKFTLLKDEKHATMKAEIKWSFCELAIYVDECPIAGCLPLDALLSAINVQRPSDNIPVLCHPSRRVDSTASPTLPQEPCNDSSQPELPYCPSDVAMPIPALPPASAPQQELSFSTAFTVSCEQLDAIKSFLSNTGASGQGECVSILSVSLQLSDAKLNDKESSGAQPPDDDHASAE